MSHIVIHDDRERMTQYRQFDELEAAVTYLEELRNTSGIENARLFALEEVKFEVKQYFKIEVVDDVTTSVPTPFQATEVPEVLSATDDVSYVDASMRSAIESGETDNQATSGVEFDEPIDAVIPSGEPRRGLFGR